VEQLQALALMFLILHTQGYNISMVLSGSYNLLIGYLIVKLTFMPRILDMLLAISSLCYLICCFVNFSPLVLRPICFPTFWCPAARKYLLAPWLLVIGVNVQRWKEQESAAGMPT
jgi:hypothetical protein